MFGKKLEVQGDMLIYLLHVHSPLFSPPGCRWFSTALVLHLQSHGTSYCSGFNA